MTQQTYEQRVEQLQTQIAETIDATIDIIVLDDKPIVEALKSQVVIELQWEAVIAAAKRLRDALEIEADEAISSAVTAELKNSYRSTTITEAKEFAKTDPIYRDMRRLHVMAANLYDEAKGMLETVHSRRYVLNNITSAIVASAHLHIL